MEHKLTMYWQIYYKENQKVDNEAELQSHAWIASQLGQKRNRQKESEHVETDDAGVWFAGQVVKATTSTLMKSTDELPWI